MQIDHLEDAEGAGGGDAAACTLIVTEGHSAKTSAVAGLEVSQFGYSFGYSFVIPLLLIRDSSALNSAINPAMIHRWSAATVTASSRYVASRSTCGTCPRAESRIIR